MAPNAKEQLRCLLTNEVKMAAAAAAAAAAAVASAASLQPTPEESARNHFQHLVHRHPFIQDFIKRPVV